MGTGDGGGVTATGGAARRTPLHMLVRTDDNGVRVMVRAGLSEAGAEAAVRAMTLRGHKQSFEAFPYGEGQLDEALARLGVVR